jgi:tRNA(Ile)-lysidine synthetase-like protein
MSLSDLYQQWMSHPEWWFNNTAIDPYLSTSFGSLLDMHLDPCNKEEYIGLILLYDQVVRHIHRGNIDIINKYLTKAIPISQTVYGILKNKLSDSDFCFVLLPLRHTNKHDNIKFVIQETLQRIHSPLIRRFFKATLDKYKFNPSIIIHHLPTTEYEWSLDRFKDFLEYAPDTLTKHTFRETDLSRAIQTHIPKGSYIVSLSGGVDSMVCAFIMKHMDYDIKAVHINYNNREIEEENFVRSWCQEINISLYIRHISEISREPCMVNGFRELYETYTRNVRYNTYKHVFKSPKVVLGHNHDDCFENILTNVSKGDKYDNLKGMTIESTLDGICFLRPLLHIPKRDIYQYAITQGIPFLTDSTPSWSQRGKIRDVVRPTLHTWNPLVINGLFKLSDYVSDCNHLLDDIVNMRICETIDGTLKLSACQYIKMELFWGKYIHKLYGCHVSKKSIRNLIIKLNDKKPVKVHLSKQLECMITKDYINICVS